MAGSEGFYDFILTKYGYEVHQQVLTHSGRNSPGNTASYFVCRPSSQLNAQVVLDGSAAFDL
ncbi:hypothetical protein, partial [Thiolapillus sp.]